MKLKSITVNLPVLDLRACLAPGSRYEFLSPFLAKPGETYLHGFGVAGDRKLRVDWRAHETVFFRCQGSILLPSRLPDSFLGATVSRTVRRLYLDCGAGVRFDLSLFTNPMYCYPPSEGEPHQWIRSFWEQTFVLLDRGKRQRLPCPQALSSLVRKFCQVSTPHHQQPRFDNVKQLTPQILLIIEADLEKDLTRNFRVPFYPANEEKTLFVGSDKVTLPGTSQRVPVAYIAHPVGHLNCPRPQRRQRFEQLRLVRAFLAWLHTDLELLQMLIRIAHNEPTLSHQLIPLVADLNEGVGRLSIAAITPEIKVSSLVSLYEARLVLARQAERWLRASGNALGQPNLFVGKIIQRKLEEESYDVFFCYDHADRESVLQIGTLLRETFGILPWMDVCELQPGKPRQREIESQLERIKSAAVFVGENGIGPDQAQEVRALMSEFTRRECPVIPVILPECTNDPVLPPFLRQMHWVDFRSNKPEPLTQLFRGIEGRQSA